MSMRCDRASTIALLSHPKYCQRPDLLNAATLIAEYEITRYFEYAVLVDLPGPLAQSLLEPRLPEILKTQRSTGLWKIEAAERKSFWLLSALNHSSLLVGLLNKKAFRYDPFKPFQESQDPFGYIVRNGFTHLPLETDDDLMKSLVSTIFQSQQTDGSWEHSIVVTCKKLELLYLLDKDSRPDGILKAIEWLFSTFNIDMEGFHTGVVYGIPAHHMFSTPDRLMEFEKALLERSEWDPKRLCYHHLAIIQNGIAIQTLIRFGYQDDERVVKACNNLSDMKEKYGGWCQSYMVEGLTAYRRRMGRS